MPELLQSPQIRRTWVHDTPSPHRIVDPMGVQWLESESSDTLVRMGLKSLPPGHPPLAEVTDAFLPRGSLRIHRSHAVNPHRVTRLLPSGRDYDLQLEPPINIRLPIIRDPLDDVRAYFGP